MRRCIILLLLLAAPIRAFADSVKVVPDTLGATSASAHSIAELLEGEVAGVRVNREGTGPLAPVRVDIRGASTLRGDDQPLWIVDGAIMENVSGTNVNAFWNYPEVAQPAGINTFFHLSPYDIESIEILKDASATALYGSRGAAGVIIVKTKLSGEQGGENFQWNSNVGCEFDGGLIHNHYLNVGAAKRNTAFNSSLSYRNYASGADGVGSDDLSFRSSFETKAAKGLWFGASIMGGAGVFDNTGTGLADYQDNGKHYGATASAWLRFNILPGLDWTTNAGADYRSENRFIWYGTGNNIGAAYKGLAGITNNTALSCDVLSSFNFKRYLAVKHGLSANLGVEWYGGHNTYNSLAAHDYLAEELKAYGISISNSVRPTFAFDESPSHAAVFGRIGYSFNDLAGINATWRADKAMSAFDGRIEQYPAADIWADLHKAFLKSSKIVSQLRLTAGFGYSGNERSLLYPFFDKAVDAGTVPQIETARRTYFDARSLQRLREWNTGLRAGFLSNRIVVEGKYFDRFIDDSFDIFDSGVKDTDGKWKKSDAVLHSSRSSSFTSRGFEIGISALLIKTDDIVWSLRGNFTAGRTQVVEINEESANGVIGYPVGSLMGWDVDSNGYYKDIVPDGIINRADCIMLGNRIPESYGGFGSTIKFQGFTLDLDADYAFGFNEIDDDSMREENRTMLTPRYILMGDFMRLSRAALYYDIPLHTPAVKGLTVSLSGYNLFTVMPSVVFGFTLKL